MYPKEEKNLLDPEAGTLGIVSYMHDNIYRAHGCTQL